MEIVAFLSRRRRLIAALAIVPIGAAVVVGALAAREDPRHRAEQVVAVPADGDTASIRLQAMTDFRELVRTQTVRDAVAEATGMRPSAVRDSLTTRQLGLSGLVRVRFESSERDVVVEGVRAATSTALDLLTSDERSVAEAEIRAADQRITDLTAELEKVAAEAGHPLPRERYEAVSTQLSQLRIAREQHVAAGDAAAADGLVGTIDALEVELARLAPAAARVDVVNDQMADARRRRSEAEQQLVAAQAALDTAVAGLGEPTGPREVARRPAIVRSAATAAGVGVAVAALLLVLIELVGGTRRQPPSIGVEAPSDNGAGLARHRAGARATD